MAFALPNLARLAGGLSTIPGGVTRTDFGDIQLFDLAVSLKGLVGKKLDDLAFARRPKLYLFVRTGVLPKYTPSLGVPSMNQISQAVRAIPESLANVVLHGQRRKRANFESVSTSAIVSRRRIRLMRCGGVLFFAFLLTALPGIAAEKIDNRNFSIDTCYPTPNEIQLAEQRARKYWAKHASRFGNNPFYLAVETSIIFPNEVQGKSPKLNYSETTASNRRRSYSYLVLKGVMIFDIRTDHFVGNTGFIAVDTPPLGGVARFDNYIARYIGFGNWP